MSMQQDAEIQDSLYVRSSERFAAFLAGTLHICHQGWSGIVFNPIRLFDPRA
jgi:hypothetical protein